MSHSSAGAAVGLCGKPGPATATWPPVRLPGGARGSGWEPALLGSKAEADLTGTSKCIFPHQSAGLCVPIVCGFLAEDKQMTITPSEAEKRNVSMAQSNSSHLSSLPPPHLCLRPHRGHTILTQPLCSSGVPPQPQVSIFVG